jgi:hypothetical protein
MRRKPFNFCGPRGGLRRISSTGAYLSLPLNLFCGTHWRDLGYLNDCWTLLDRRHAVWRNWATTVRTHFPIRGTCVRVTRLLLSLFQNVSYPPQDTRKICKEAFMTEGVEELVQVTFNARFVKRRLLSFCIKAD